MAGLVTDVYFVMDGADHRGVHLTLSEAQGALSHCGVPGLLRTRGRVEWRCSWRSVHEGQMGDSYGDWQYDKTVYTEQDAAEFRKPKEPSWARSSEQKTELKITAFL